MLRSRLAFAVLLSLGSAVTDLVACSSPSSTASLPCGPGTHAEKNQCVADGSNATSDDAATKGGDASLDAPPETTLDAGLLVHNGDPCPKGNQSVCSAGHVYQCQLVANGTHPLGTLWESLDCTLLEGACTIDRGGNGSCTGGGYTACQYKLNDAGNHLDMRRCISTKVLADCNGVAWTATNCALDGRVCASAGATWACVPP